MSAILFIRRPDGLIETQLDVFTQFDAIDRFRDVGSWSLTAPSSDKTELLATPGYGLIAEVDGQEFLAGPQWTVEDSWDGEKAVSVISGVSDAHRLWDRLCYPSAPLFTAEAYNVPPFSPPAEGAMKHYVHYNVLDDSRKVPAIAQLAIASDRGRGLIIPVQARFEIVGDKLVSIATTGGGLGFQVRDLTFDVYEPADRRNEITFSKETGNLLEFKRKRSGPTANRIICGGKGELTARVFRIGADDTSAALWGRYIELFRDRRDTDEVDQLDDSILEELMKGAEKNEVTLRAVDTPGRKYGVDWNLGDIVTAQGIESVVAQAQLTLDADGQVIKPAVGATSTVAASTMLRAYDELRAVRRRIAFLERST